MQCLTLELVPTGQMEISAEDGDPKFGKCETVYVSLLQINFKLNVFCKAYQSDGHIDLLYGSAPEP